MDYLRHIEVERKEVKKNTNAKKVFRSKADAVAHIILLIRGMWVYNKEVFFGIPALWLLGAYHAVMACLPTALNWKIDGANITFHCCLCALYLLATAIRLYLDDNEDEEDTNKRKYRVRRWLRKVNRRRARRVH